MQFRSSFLSICLIFFIIIPPLHSQCPWNKWKPETGVTVRQGVSIDWWNSSAIRIQGESTGEIAYVWTDTRTGFRDVYLQVIDVNQAFKFQENGLPLIVSLEQKIDPVVCPDADGGWLVAWLDFRADSLGDIYCTKVNSDGELLWGAETNGIPVSNRAGTQANYHIISDTEGGCIFAWEDRIDRVLINIVAQHIQSDGTIDAGWAEEGVMIAEGIPMECRSRISSDDAGGMILVWQEAQAEARFDIMAQRINVNGELLWGDGEPIPVSSEDNDPCYPEICPDGDGGFFCTWMENRNMIDNDQDIYAQHVNSGGTPLWDDANLGAPICTATNAQGPPRIIPSSEGSAIIVWEDQRNGEEEQAVYGMRISGNDEFVLEWETEQGTNLTVVENFRRLVGLTADNQGGAYLATEGNGELEGLRFVQHVMVDGGLDWDESGVLLSVQPIYFYPDVYPTAEGNALVTAGAFMNGQILFFDQLLSENGEIIPNENDSVFVSGIGGIAHNHQLIPTGDNQFALVWNDTRSRFGQAMPYVQFCRNGGDNVEMQLPNNGIPVLESETPGGGVSPRAIATEDGGLIVVWEDQRIGQHYAIYAQKFSNEGEYLWDPEGVKCADFNYHQTLPQLCTDNEGGVIVFWNGMTGDDHLDIYLQRMSGDGERLWGNTGVQLTRDDYPDMVESVCPDGNGGAVIVWRKNHPDTNYDLYVERIFPNGRPAWGNGEQVLSTARYHQRDAFLLHHPNGFFVVWSDGRNAQQLGTEYDLYGQFVQMDGTSFWREEGVNICNESNDQLHPVAAVDVENKLWIAWEDNRFRNDARLSDIYCQRLSYRTNVQNLPIILLERNGHPVTNGVAICQTWGEQCEPAIIPDAEGGIWVTWVDGRHGNNSDIYATHIDEAGAPVHPWPMNGNPVCAVRHKQERAQVALLDNNDESGIVVTWRDQRSTYMEPLYALYCQRVGDFIVDGVKDDSNEELPLDFSLESIYPNPFNNSVRIEYRVSAPGLIRLSVYDLNGREYFREAVQAASAGQGAVNINASNMPSGIYMVRMQSGDVTRYSKIVCLK